MNIYGKTVLEVIIGDRYYKLEIMPGSPPADINQALLQMNQYVNQVIASQAAKEENPSSDTPTEVV